MGTVYGLLGILFGLVLTLLILVIKYRNDVAFLKDMFKINNDYVKECEKDWSMAIGMCRKVCERNEELYTKIHDDQ